MTESNPRPATVASTLSEDSNGQEMEPEYPEEKLKGRTVIIQSYISRPLLINNRKFDFRIFALFTSINGHVKGYFYEDGYIRTSSREFDLDNLDDRYIHLTNDAI